MKTNILKKSSLLFLSLVNFISPANADGLYDLKYKMKLKANEISEASAPVVENGGGVLFLLGTMLLGIVIVLILIAILRR